MPFAGYLSPDLRKRVAALIVTQALVPSQDPGAFSLHPCLERWQDQLWRRYPQWFSTSLDLPISWYAGLVGASPSRLLAAAAGDLPEDTAQIWVASPYHARLARDSVHLLPEGQLGMSRRDSQWLCDELNPLLQQEGMRLVPVGAALLLCCRTPWDVRPASLDRISGHTLPDRHPEGADGGRLMRLLSEIQMHLHRHPAAHRREMGEHDIHGLWFWGEDVPAAGSDHAAIPVATRNPLLQAVAEGRAARLVLSEAERLGELIGGQQELPDMIVLSGHGHAVQLGRRWLGRPWPLRRRAFRLQPAERPKRLPGQEMLIARIRRLLHAG